MADIKLTTVQPTFFTNLGITERVVERSDQFQILGDFCQIVHVKLAPNQKVQVEPGVMCYMSDECKESVKLANIGRIIMEGDLVKGFYENKSSSPGYIGLTSNLPGNIIPINLDAMGGSIKAKRDGFMAAFDPKCKITMSLLASASLCGCCCADTPLFMQQITGKGWVFLSAHGTIMQKMLKKDEEIVVEGNTLVACSSTMTCDAVYSGSCSMMVCGGEGLFNTSLKGPGLAILSSLPLDKLRKLFPVYPQGSKKSAPDTTLA